METFDSIPKLRNGKRFNTARDMNMTGNDSSENNFALNFRWIKENEESEIRTLTQEQVRGQIKSFIVHLTRQLEDLTRLDQRRSVTSHPNHYPGLIPTRVITPWILVRHKSF